MLKRSSKTAMCDGMSIAALHNWPIWTPFVAQRGAILGLAIPDPKPYEKGAARNRSLFLESAMFDGIGHRFYGPDARPLWWTARNGSLHCLERKRREALAASRAALPLLIAGPDLVAI